MQDSSSDSNAASGAEGATPVKSPCINVCALDIDDICEGCYRSVSEITRWAGMEEEEKKRVLQRCWQRAKSKGRIL